MFLLPLTITNHNKTKFQMDAPRGSDSEPENPIAACTAMLSLRHFSACRDFASRLPLSDSVSRILAIADVLSAADFYSVLQLPRADVVDRELARRQYAKLALLLDPTLTDKFPFSDEALARVHEAWHVLSDTERCALYNRDFELRRCGDQMETFWTACPYCWNLFQYEKMYEDCSLLCQSCQRVFHGVAVKPPEKVGEPVVEGEERRQYYWCRASVPLKYYEVKEKVEDGDKNLMDEKTTQFVYISDDDDEEGAGFGKKVGQGVVGDVRNEGFQRVIQGNGTAEHQANGKRRMRIKTVAKKVVGKRMARCLDSDSDLDLGSDGGDGELEFTEGDGDVFVGVRFND